MLNQLPVPPCVLFEDDHLLVVHKPAGWNTHAPGPHAGEGIYDWLRHREPRWAALAIVHRLDKETSGVLVFSKTTDASRSLTKQFTERIVRKRYLLLTDRAPKRDEFTVRSKITRAGERYVSGPAGEPAETRFRVLPEREASVGAVLLEAAPLTGRTHQIRVHAVEQGLPILGDRLYGGTPFARVCLHAASIELAHPADSRALRFEAPVDFTAPPAAQLRAAFIDLTHTDAYRLLHGAADGWPGWQVDRLGQWLLSQSERELTPAQRAELERLRAQHGALGAYHKSLLRQVRGKATTDLSPALVLGEAAPDRFVIRENGARFELSFAEGYSVGLFLDQRDNRRRLLINHVAATFSSLLIPHSSRPEILNTFAYTCGLSVCAARAGARVTSLDLSRKYLDWGRRNFALNELDPAAHDFIHGDALDWLQRLAKKGRAFDAVLLDPPTFSQSKEHGRFQVEKDMGRLVTAALAVLRPGGVLFASSNAARWKPVEFLAQIESAIADAGRRIEARHYAPQPPDFPVHRDEPAYLKTVWLRVR
jgi:23S rRNA (cytosine1962-C5)-methyltransferase